jgi:hypothetical protein
MLLIPIQSADHKEDAVIVVIDGVSLERMQKADPAEIVLRQSGKHLVNPTLLFCFERDHVALNKFIQANNIKGLIKHLQRGWKFRPELGDHDRGPESIKAQN